MLRKHRHCTYLHEFNTRFEWIVESEKQQKVLLHWQKLGQLKTQANGN